MTHIIRNILVFLLVAIGYPSLAQTSESAGSNVSNETILVTTVGILLLVTVLILVAVIYVLIHLKNVIGTETTSPEEEAAEEKESWWQKFYSKATDAVPVEKEETILLDHNYDGIKELDNHLPPWWTALFYITIAFGVVYLFVYHVFGVAPLQEEEYRIEMAQAAEAAAARNLASLNEETVELTDNPDALARGGQLYVSNCAACHGQEGQGTIGPNLTDKYWLHGGDIKAIFRTIKYGVLEKGMKSWQKELSPSEMRDVSSYILTLQGTNPINAKEPQGELFEYEVEGGEIPDTTVSTSMTEVESE